MQTGVNQYKHLYIHQLFGGESSEMFNSLVNDEDLIIQTDVVRLRYFSGSRRPIYYKCRARSASLREKQHFLPLKVPAMMLLS